MKRPGYFRARAPLRLSFCGGGTDVSPYPEEHGGMVLSATINQYAYASLRPRRDTRLTIASLDYDVVARYDHPRRLKLDGNLDLIKSVVKALKVRRGADLWVHSDAPPGSGLGSSSTLVVALIGVLSEWHQKPLSGYEVAELAYRIERVDLGLAGGRQDQYAAAFGGFNFIEFQGQTTVVNPLRIRPDVLRELEYRMLLCYMGQTRQSARIIERQIASYVGGRRKTIEALGRLKRETLEMKQALLLGDIDGMGEQDLSIGVCLGDVPDQFARDVARVEVGENQHVRVAGHLGIVRLARGDLGHERRIHLQFPIEVRFQEFLLRLAFGQRGGGLDFADGGMRGAAFGGKRK